MIRVRVEREMIRLQIIIHLYTGVWIGARVKVRVKREGLGAKITTHTRHWVFFVRVGVRVRVRVRVRVSVSVSVRVRVRG